MLHKPIILMADDDEEDLELIEEAILDKKPDVLFQKVTNGKGVIDYLNNQPHDQLPCLIILDYNMPEQTGLQVLIKICNDPRYKAIPKVILSTSSTRLHIDECMNSGATEYFVKPHNMADINLLAKKMMALCS